MIIRKLIERNTLMPTTPDELPCISVWCKIIT